MRGNEDDIVKSLPVLEHVLKSSVESIELDKKTFDLNLSFSNGDEFNLFCNQSGEEECMDNYLFFTPKEIYTVEGNLVLTREERTFK